MIDRSGDAAAFISGVIDMPDVAHVSPDPHNPACSPKLASRKTDMPALNQPPMTPDSRRKLVERIFEKARARGETIENDPLFRGWIEQWIDGEIDLADLRERYRQLLQDRRSSERRALDD